MSAWRKGVSAWGKTEGWQAWHRRDPWRGWEKSPLIAGAPGRGSRTRGMRISAGIATANVTAQAATTRPRTDATRTLWLFPRPEILKAP